MVNLEGAGTKAPPYSLEIFERVRLLGLNNAKYEEIRSEFTVIFQAIHLKFIIENILRSWDQSQDARKYRSKNYFALIRKIVSYFYH